MKMNTGKTLLFGFAVFAAAGLIQRAQAVDNGVYDLNFQLSNSIPIYEVQYVPRFDAGLTDTHIWFHDYGVNVDGAGKITGFALVTVANQDVGSTMMLTVSGSMTTKGTAPSITFKLNGSGYATNGTVTAPCTLNLKFVGSTSTFASSSSSTATFGGLYNGKFSTKIPGATTTVKDLPASVLAYGGSLIESCTIRMVINGSAASIGGCFNLNDGVFHNEWNGTGKGNPNGKFNLTMTGTGPAVGSSLTLKGMSEDNPDTGGADFYNVSATGKILGQKVKATGYGANLTPYTGE